MKICSKCKLEKNVTDFYKSQGKERRTQAKCKSCFNTYVMERWKNRKIKVIEQFGNVCYDCNQTYHPNVFDFHHLDPGTKDFDWSKMRLFSEARMQAELSKCVMLCANCHRTRHALFS